MKTRREYTPSSKLKLAGLHAWSTASNCLARIEQARPLKLPRLRVALVKQSSYHDLYSLPGCKDTKALLLSSNHRPGPIGLFECFDTDFHIVHCEKDTECRVWEEKLPSWQQGEQRWKSRQEIMEHQKALAVHAGEINWSPYDLVIAIENAVPARVTRKYPQTVWATMLEHHRMSPYKSYRRVGPPPGYDLFFNQFFTPNPASLIRKKHDIEWPYSFNLPGLYQRLFPEVQKEDDLVFMEDHQDITVLEAMCARQGLRLQPANSTDCGSFIRNVLRASYFVALDAPRPIYGNALVDAISAGTLILGCSRRNFNAPLYPPSARVSGPKGCEKRLSIWSRDTEARQVQLDTQSRRMHRFLVERPMSQLLDALSILKRTVKLRDYIPACAH